jgi:putative transposase
MGSTYLSLHYHIVFSTASHTHRDPLKAYIGGQEEHHRTLSFMDELKHLLKKNAVEYDPKYLV